LEVWFQDEARVGQQGTLGVIWAEIGSCPPGVRDDRHESAWLFGAVCPQRSMGAALVMPWVSSEAMTHHLDAIAAAVQPGSHAVLVCDGAGWHRTGGRLVVPDNITMLPLPGYAPELNPIENVWAYLRGNYLNMSVWGTYEEIVSACCKAWNAFIADVTRVATITQRTWASVNV
jgi:putative transposase